jgi:hypothetical protein
MAFNKAPSAWLGAGYSADSANDEITFTTADAGSDIGLPQLTNAEAHATTGDVRAIAHALVERLFQVWNATQGADRPVRMSLFKNLGQAPNGVDLIVNYQFQFQVTPQVEVADEPS